MKNELTDNSVNLPENVPDIIDASRSRFIRMAGICGVVVAVAWPVSRYIFHLGDPSVGFNSVLAAISLGVYVFGRFKKVSALGYGVVTSIVFVTTLYMMFSPGGRIEVNDNSFISVFLLWSFFFLGKKYGLISSVLYAVVLILFMVTNIFQQSTSPSMIFSVTVSLIFSLAILYIYQDTQEKITI